MVALGATWTWRMPVVACALAYSASASAVDTPISAFEQAFVNLDRRQVLETVLGGAHDALIVADPELTISQLTSPKIDDSVRFHMARVLLRQSRLNYAQAAAVIGVAHQIERDYNTIHARFTPALYVQMFPIEIEDRDIQAIAEQQGWRLTEHEWSWGFWVGDVKRSAAAGERGHLPFLGDIAPLPSGGK